MGELEKRLTELVSKKRSRLRKRQKAHYELAKAYGFSADEAAVLQNWNEQAIHLLARERGYTLESVK